MTMADWDRWGERVRKCVLSAQLNDDRFRRNMVRITKSLPEDQTEN